MESWRKVWREGIHPLLSVEQLEACRNALLTDDLRLIQGATTVPPPMQCTQYWPVEAACLLGLCGVVEHGGFGVATVGDTEETFAKLCFECDRLIGEPAACRFFVNWIDETPRDKMLTALLSEVQCSLALKSDTQ